MITNLGNLGRWSPVEHNTLYEISPGPVRRALSSSTFFDVWLRYSGEQPGDVLERFLVYFGAGHHMLEFTLPPFPLVAAAAEGVVHWAGLVYRWPEVEGTRGYVSQQNITAPQFRVFGPATDPGGLLPHPPPTPQAYDLAAAHTVVTMKGGGAVTPLPRKPVVKPVKS